VLPGPEEVGGLALGHGAGALQAVKLFHQLGVAKIRYVNGVQCQLRAGAKIKLGAKAFSMTPYSVDT